MARGKIDMSVDEIVGTLRNSRVPNVVVEGSDDIIVLRRMEDIFSDASVSLIEAGGREKLLQVYDALASISLDTPVAFVADRDAWVFQGIPESYNREDIIFSNGYSIENDIYRDGDFYCYLDSSEKVSFKREIDVVCAFFSIQMASFLENGSGNVKAHANFILEHEECSEFVNCCTRDPRSEELYRKVVAEPERLLRGKTLMATLMRHLSYPGRVAHHRHQALFDLVGAKAGPIISELFQRVGRVLSVEASAKTMAES